MFHILTIAGSLNIIKWTLFFFYCGLILTGRKKKNVNCPERSTIFLTMRMIDSCCVSSLSGIQHRWLVGRRLEWHRGDRPQGLYAPGLYPVSRSEVRTGEAALKATNSNNRQHRGIFFSKNEICVIDKDHTIMLQVFSHSRMKFADNELFKVCWGCQLQVSILATRRQSFP